MDLLLIINQVANYKHIDVPRAIVFKLLTVGDMKEKTVEKDSLC